MSLLLVEGAAGGPVTATLTQTEQNDNLTSAAALAIQASLTATEANDSLTSAAALAVQASLTASEANDTLTSASALAIQATLTATEDNDSLSSAASLGGGVSADLTATEQDDTLSSTATIEQPVEQISLGQNQRRPRQVLKFRARKVRTAEELYREVVNPPPPPLADIPGEVDREIAYRMRALEADQVADRVARQAAKARLAAELKAVEAQEEEDAILAIMTMILMDEAA